MKNTEDIISKTELLKLPSADVVTADILWQFVQSITSEKFTKEQMKSFLPSSSKNTVPRVLAYLKYMEYLTESREEVNEGEKKKKIQYFIVNKELPLVKDVQYEIKAGRKESAKEKWFQLVREHVLSRTIVKEFFGDDKTKTRIDLENFLKERKELRGKQPSYYQHGVTFIIKLLSQVGTLSSSGNNLNLDEKVQEEKQKPTEEPPREDEGIKSNKFDGKSYTVTIKGPDLDTTLEINEEFDLQIVEKFLEKIKSKLTPAETEDQKDEDSESPN